MQGADCISPEMVRASTVENIRSEQYLKVRKHLRKAHPSEGNNWNKSVRQGHTVFEGQ